MKMSLIGFILLAVALMCWAVALSFRRSVAVTILGALFLLAAGACVVFAGITGN